MGSLGRDHDSIERTTFEALKSDESPVTRADIAAHQILIDGLTKLTKDIPVVSEEDPDSVAIGRRQTATG